MTSVVIRLRFWFRWGKLPSGLNLRTSTRLPFPVKFQFRGNGGDDGSIECAAAAVVSQVEEDSACHL